MILVSWVFCYDKSELASIKLNNSPTTITINRAINKESGDFCAYVDAVHDSCVKFV